MWEFMENHAQSVFVQSYDEGIARVKRGGYAFLMESTILDYVVQVFIYYGKKEYSYIRIWKKWQTKFLLVFVKNESNIYLMKFLFLFVNNKYNKYIYCTI